MRNMFLHSTGPHFRQANMCLHDRVSTLHKALTSGKSACVYMSLCLHSIGPILQVGGLVSTHECVSTIHKAHT